MSAVAKSTAELAAEQAAHWNGPGGQGWLRAQARLDHSLVEIGRRVLALADAQPGETAIDVGCGPGGTTAALAQSVGSEGHVLGVDISQPLIDAALTRRLSNATFVVADAATHPFDAAAADLVFSRFGVMFFADPVAAFRNIRASGGRLGFVCWRPMRENPSFTVPISAALPFLPEPPKPTEPGAPGPFAFEDEARVRSILESAGYSDIAVTANDTKLAFGGGGLDAAVDLAFHVGPLSRALPTIPEADRPRVRAAVEEAFAPYVGPSGVLMPAATWIVTAR